MNTQSAARRILSLVATLLVGLTLHLCAPSNTALALDDPTLEYQTITTPHFEVHYDRRLDALARKVAVTCEESHEVLAPLLDWTPAARTQVFVRDRVDTANGSATVYARNTINIFGMPPQSDSVLGYYDDWIRILVYHEYVHVLHLDTTYGISPLVNVVIGKILNPNQIAPRWYIEGLATYYESARTGTGRVNSSLYRMWLRAEALNPEVFTLGQTSNSPTRWPFGSLAYLFGSFFIDYVANKLGEQALTDFHKIYGARLIPYSLNSAMRAANNTDFDSLWSEWTASIQADALATRVKVNALGRTPLELITSEGGETKYPRIRPGANEVSFHSDTRRSHPTINITSQQGTEITPLFEVDAAPGTSNWFPDGEKLVYSRSVVYKNVYNYQDLFVWDARLRTHKQLTRRERAREPAVSPDGARIVYVRNVNGTMELVLREFADGGFKGAERVLISGEDWAWDDDRHWQQIATPEFSPDGSKIVFSWWRMDLRERDLWVYDLDAPERERLSPLMRDAAMDLDPHFAPDGLLYFTSDSTGIYNIHAMDIETRERWQISNVLTGVFSPRVSEDRQWIYVTTYTQRGYDIARMPRPTRRWRATPENTRFQPWRRYPEVDTSTFTMSRYRPGRFLAPLTFLPNLGASTAGTSFSGTFTGYDPLYRHSYSLTAGIATNPGFRQPSPNATLAYRYSGFPFNLSANAGYSSFPRQSNLFVGSQYVPYLEQQSLGQVAISYPFQLIDSSFTIGGSYTVDHRAYFAEPDAPAHEPGDLEPIPASLGFFNQASLSAGYARLERYGYSISIQKGVQASINATIRDPVLGSQTQSLGLNYSVAGYVPVPKFERQVLSLSIAGGMLNVLDPALFYVMGGNAIQNVFSSLVFQNTSSTLVVRGYPPAVLSGNKYIVSSGQWRFPLLDIDRGFSTTPVYIRQLKGRLFMDAGSAYTGYLSDAEPLLGAGGEVLLTALFGYYLTGTLRLGYARGLTGEDAIHDVYLLYGGGF